MKLNSSSLQILGLTNVEQKVFDTLSFEKSLSVTTLGEQAAVPRTSALSALERLSERGLVRKVSTGKKTLWKKTNPEKLRRSVTSLLTGLKIEEQLEQFEKEVAVRVSAQSEFIVLHGAENLLRFQEQNIKKNTGERAFLIQGSLTGETVAKRGLTSEFARLNSLIKEAGIITELLVSDSTLARYKKRMEQDDAWRKSMKSRLLVLHAVSDAILPDNAFDVVIYKNVTALTNWKEETAVVMKNRDTMQVFQNWFHSLAVQGQKIDPNKFFV